MSNSKNQVLSIAYVAEKGKGVIFSQKATLVQDKGMDEDYHSKFGDGLIVIVSKPLLDWMEQVSPKGLCFGRFKYNICFEDSIEHLKSGDTFTLGEAQLIMSKRQKPCFAAEQPCKMPPDMCKLPVEMKFVEIQKGGIINVGDIFNI